MTTGSQKTQTMQLPVDGGVDQRTHARQLQAPNVIEATNVRFPRIGAVEKRHGLDLVAYEFSNGATFDSGGEGRLIAFRDELLVTDAFRIGSMTLAGGGAQFVDKGKVPEGVSSSTAIDSTQYQVSQPDIAYSSDGYVFHVWGGNDRTGINNTFNIFCTVQDVATGAEILSASRISAGDGWCPRVVAVGNAVLAMWAGTFSANIQCRVWNPTTLSWGVEFTAVNDRNSSSSYFETNFALCTDGTSAFISYTRVQSPGPLFVTVKKFNPVTGGLIATISSTEVLGSNVAQGHGICATAGERVWVTFSKKIIAGSGADVRACAFNLALSAETTAPFTLSSHPADVNMITTSPARITATTAVVLLGVSIGAPPVTGKFSYISAPVITSSGAIQGNASVGNRIIRWAIPGSAPFVVTGSPMRCYAWAYVGGAAFGSPIPPAPPDQPLQYTYMLIDLNCDDTSSVRLVARPITWQAPRFAQPDLFTNGVTNLPELPGGAMYSPSSSVRVGDYWTSDFIVKRNASTRTGLQQTRVTFAGPGLFIASELGRTAIVTPGFYWDRSKLAEVSFAYWPQRICEPVPSGTGGAMTNAKSYSYRVLYEYVDATGAVHRSQPSDAVIVAIPAGAGTAGSVVFNVPTLTVTARQGPLLADQETGVRLVVYRAGPLDVDPITYYRVFDERTTPKNDPLTGFVTVTDTHGNFTGAAPAAPFTRVQADTLYTMGGVLPNVMPPGFTSVCTYRNRTWIAHGNTVSYSKAFVTGEAISFTDAFDLPLEEGGDITALWVMDDTLYISTRDRIYWLQAYGPNDTGQQSDVNIPDRVATDLGVIDQRSIVVTPIGTMYQSAVGIQNMTRGRAVDPEPIGARVQNELAAYPEITSAIVHPSGSYVQFCARNPNFSSDNYVGVRLIYDYTTNKWSRDKVQETLTFDGQGLGLQNEVVSRGRVYTMINYAFDGELRVFGEGGGHLDHSQWVTMTVDLAEIHPSGLQGWLGFEKWTLNHERFTDHDITMQWYRNYETAPFETKTWASVDLPHVANEQFSHNPAIHRAQSMRLRISDAAPTGSGQVVGNGRGAALIGVAVEVDPLDNKTFRLPAAAKG